MSITDELREYANKVIYREDYMAGLAFDLNRIADRIDEVHKREVVKGLNEHQHGRDEGWDEAVELMEREYVRLPVDADGELIHIGDVMDNTHKRGFAAKTVIGISHHEGGKMCVRVDEDELRWHDPLKLHHHHEPTVEDVLREMCLEIDRRYARGRVDYDELFAEYAEKLREVVEHERD